MVISIVRIFLVLAPFCANAQKDNNAPNYILPTRRASRSFDTLTDERVHMLKMGLVLAGRDTAQTVEHAFFNQLATLPEFIQEKKNIKQLRDSTGSKVKLDVDYHEKYEEGPEGMAAVFLDQVNPDGSITCKFTIMFDKALMHIVSVEDHLKKRTRKLEVLVPSVKTKS